MSRVRLGLGFWGFSGRDEMLGGWMEEGLEEMEILVLLSAKISKL